MELIETFAIMAKDYWRDDIINNCGSIALGLLWVLLILSIVNLILVIKKRDKKTKNISSIIIAASIVVMSIILIILFNIPDLIDY